MSGESIWNTWFLAFHKGCALLGCIFTTEDTWLQIQNTEYKTEHLGTCLVIIYFSLPHGLKDLVFTSCQYRDTLQYYYV